MAGADDVIGHLKVVDKNLEQAVDAPDGAKHVVAEQEGLIGRNYPGVAKNLAGVDPQLDKIRALQDEARSTEAGPSNGWPGCPKSRPPTRSNSCK